MTTIEHTAQNPQVGFTLTDLETFATKLQDAGLDPETPIGAVSGYGWSLLTLAVTA